MKFEIIAEGFVSRREPGTPGAVAAMSRCALARTGEIVCTFIVQSKLGVNDFKPMICRSIDGGRTWSAPEFIWPHLHERFSSSCAISRAPNGDLHLYGKRTPIDQPGESAWSDATQGLKQNELYWSRSTDDGKTWSEPAIIPMPIPGSAEAPGALTVTRGGRWLACYAPYNTFDPRLVVDRSQVVCVRSDDQGKSWKHNSMIRFESPNSTAAESWVIELSDGRLLGTTWHLNQQDKTDHPNAYALSEDGGESWLPTRSTGILGQSTALAALPDGRALFIYNQRKHGPPGVYLAAVRPTRNDFGVGANEIIWSAQTRTQGGTSGGHSEWTDFSFGEPSVTPLPDGTLFATLWCIQPSGQGIRHVHLRMLP